MTRWVVLLALAGCGTLPVVFPRADAGESCSEARPCTAPFVCDGAGGCVECVVDADCRGALPACDAATRRCVACRGELGCTAPEVCSPTSPVCVRPCASGSNACPGYAGGCRSNFCAACQDDEDCGVGRRCDSFVGRCVACLVDRDCSSTAQPHCDSAKGACVGCVGNQHCVAPEACFEGACR